MKTPWKKTVPFTTEKKVMSLPITETDSALASLGFLQHPKGSAQPKKALGSEPMALTIHAQTTIAPT
jgi:hypothetical protein